MPAAMSKKLGYFADPFFWVSALKPGMLMQIEDAAAVAWRGGLLAREAVAQWSGQLQQHACVALLSTCQEACHPADGSAQVRIQSSTCSSAFFCCPAQSQS